MAYLMYFHAKKDHGGQFSPVLHFNNENVIASLLETQLQYMTLSLLNSICITIHLKDETS